jgi:5-methylcytosine-specific restriction enzyme subunit McrC
MRASPYRISLTENKARPVLAAAAAELGQTRQEVAALLAETSRRLRKLQRLKNEPIVIDGDHVKVVELAGLIRVETGLELEVAPKFLGHETDGWREDFFRIASLAQSGRILPHEEISAGRGQSNDLASLVGRVMVALFKEEQRRPIRLYRHRRWDDFEIDGDLDEESVFLPSETGFAQEKIVLERGNRFNEIIAEAARLLIAEVEDQDVRRQLQRIFAQLSPQRRPLTVAGSPQRVSSRHRRWQQLYDISRRVVAGFGMDFELEEAPAPGFVLKTWPAWEDLVYLAMRTGLRGDEVEAQQSHTFGKRDGKDFAVTPDGTVSNQGVKFLWDAKYKADWERGRRRVSAPDVYEADAFLEAASVGQIALLYPRLATAGEAIGCGAVEVFETVELSTGTIYGVAVEARGISARGGFQNFSKNLAAGVSQTRGAATAAAAAAAA